MAQEPRQELEEETVNERCFPALSQAHNLLLPYTAQGMGPLPSDNSQNGPTETCPQANLVKTIHHETLLPGLPGPVKLTDNVN